MVTRGTSVLIVKVLAALATFALATVVAYWAWGRVFNPTLAGYFGLAVGVAATIVVVKRFDAIVAATTRDQRRR
jgi:hypothetical protein